jgi:hypothetical protein
MARGSWQQKLDEADEAHAVAIATQLAGMMRLAAMNGPAARDVQRAAFGPTLESSPFVGRSLANSHEGTPAPRPDDVCDRCGETRRRAAYYNDGCCDPEQFTTEPAGSPCPGPRGAHVFRPANPTPTGEAA